MNEIPYSYFSNLSSYEELVLKSNILGYDVSDKVILNSFRKIEDYYLVALDRRICLLDKNGNKAENVVIRGNFDISGYDIDSLEGSPEKIGGNFVCYNCDSLTSLVGGPKEVGGDFICFDCYSLTSLEGAPEKVGGVFDCSYCESLTSLEGAPKEVGNDFYFYRCVSLTSFDGKPKHVGGEFFGG